MPKQLPIDPGQTYSADKVRFTDIPVHAYKGDFTGAYRGIEYVYKGPAHLSVGQEAAAVGSAMTLRPADQIFGSHRSHGEIIA